ncbi:MAG: EutN/CcmL family microcompartment protein [Acidobacteria bacterium]|nr:EutN/CcmL family microcompartment protein [Acidobacteriota bacterium]
MILARVIGNIESTHKHLQYEGLKLLYVQPLEVDLEPVGDPYIAADSVDAGVGDLVLVIEEGWSSWNAVGKDKAPLNRAVVGVVDKIEFLEGAAR